MTLAAMWVESRDPANPHVGRLCFASDSRTTPGPIEGVSKVLLFTRSDLAGVWAGDFRYAALLANHLDVALSATARMRDRAVDVARLFRSAQRPVIAHLAATMKSDTESFLINTKARAPERMVMLVGGYSIAHAKFVAMRISWNPSGERWQASVKWVAPSKVVWIGDNCSQARWLASKVRRKRSEKAVNWHMEPLAAIDNYRRDSATTSIGGDLQLAKVFMHGAALAYALQEPMAEEVSVRGSRLGCDTVEEFRAQNLLVDMSRWSMRDAAYGGVRVDK